jgi:hypothetical protein
MSHAGVKSGETTATTSTRRAVFTANDVRALIAKNLRSAFVGVQRLNSPLIFRFTLTMRL